MKKSVLMFSLLSGTALMFPRLTIASGILPTHTGTPEPKPAFQFEQLDKAYKTAGVCFLGVGDCDPGAGFSRGDDYSVDTEVQCLNAGYTKQNCNSLQTIDTPCPYNAEFGLGCKCVSNLVSCPAGQVGVGDSCNGPANATQLWCLAHRNRAAAAPPVVVVTNIAIANPNTNTLPPTVHLPRF